MLYRTLADVVVVIHLLFIVFALLGGLLLLRWRWIMWIHIPAALWAALLEYFAWYCPLTPWENNLREKAGQQGYEGSFIEHYLIPIIYPDSFTREMQLALGSLVVIINVFLYWRVLRANTAP